MITFAGSHQAHQPPRAGSTGSIGPSTRPLPGQIPNPDQVVGTKSKGEHPAHKLSASVPCLVQAANRLHPAKHFVDSFTIPLAGRVAGVAGRSSVDCAAAPTLVLGHVWRNSPLSHLLDKLASVEAFVGTQRDHMIAFQIFDHRHRGFTLRSTGGMGQATTDYQTVAILLFDVTLVAQLRLFPLPLAIQAGIGIGLGAMRVIAALLAVEIYDGLLGSSGGSCPSSSIGRRS